MRTRTTLALLGLLACSNWAAAAPLTAAIHGSLTGTVQNSGGGLVAPQGAVHGSISANDNNGVITATLEGSAASTGPLGMALTFTAQYNAATQAFTGLYSDTPGQVPDLPLQFTNVGGLNWRAAISGNAPSPSGERAYALNLNVVIEPGAVFAQAALPASNVFSGRLDHQQTVQLPVNLPALQASQTVPLTMRFQGDWNATTFLDSAGKPVFTGSAAGTFSTVQTGSLTIVPTGGAMTVPVSIGGSFRGALFAVSDTELAFKGAWVSLNSGLTQGGDISIRVPLQDLSRFPYSLTGTAQIGTGAPQVPTLTLPFSANGEFPLALNIAGGSGGSGTGTPEPDGPVVASAVKIKHLGVNLGTYDPVTNRAGDFAFTREKMSFDLLFFNFGFVVPANSIGPEKVNPQPTFILPLGSKVHALIDGEVIAVTKLYSNDYSVMLKGPGSELIFEMEHVINVTVKVGDQVRAGDIVAEVSAYDAHNYAGMGLVEIGILRAVGNGVPTHLCPFDYLDDSIRESTLQRITALQQAWETYRGDASLYDESKVVVPGCYRRTPVEG